MGIPVFHQIMLPLLQLLEDKQEHSLRQVIDSLTNQEHDEYCKTQAHTLDLHFRTPPRSYLGIRLFSICRYLLYNTYSFRQLSDLRNKATI